MLTVLEMLYALDLTVDDRRHPALAEKITGVSIDTRTLQKGNVFVAIKGDQHDGHLYIPKAIEKGASVILLHDPQFCDLCAHHSYFVVPDPQKALEKLAMANRIKYMDSVFVTAITGSVGKTTLKEFLRTLFSAFGPTVASQKSFNNHLGVPLTLNDLDDDTKFGVFEIGMNHVGEIAPLSCMVDPHIAVITAIAPAHIGNMGSIEAIAQEKADIFRGLRKSGIAIMPADTPYLDILKKEAEFKNAQIVTVGTSNDADARLISCSYNEHGIAITALVFGEECQWCMPAFGEHYALLALFALCVMIKSGFALDAVLPKLACLEPLSGRGKIESITLKNGGKICIIDDSYNANITSLKAGLSVVEKISARRKIAVLGALLELDHFSQEIHTQVGQYLNQLTFDYIFSCGAEMIHAHNALKDSDRAFHGETLTDILPKLLETIKDGDLIFIKGSNSNKLWTIIDAIND
ncbi:MAG: UDP-N-acetylmuramoyl-tripeptide--D-alanyl-D-alanine ligase [Holosporales bacterium]